jgi:hypothetical protein
VRVYIYIERENVYVYMYCVDSTHFSAFIWARAVVTASPISTGPPVFRSKRSNSCQKHSMIPPLSSSDNRCDCYPSWESRIFSDETQQTNDHPTVFVCTLDDIMSMGMGMGMGMVYYDDGPDVKPPEIQNLRASSPK